MYSPRQAEIQKKVATLRAATAPATPAAAALTRAKAKIRHDQQKRRAQRDPFAQKVAAARAELEANRARRDPFAQKIAAARAEVQAGRKNRRQRRAEQRKQQRQQRKQGKGKDKKQTKTPPKPKKAPRPTSITIKGQISSDTIIRHVPVGYIPEHELEKIADISAGHLPTDYPRQALTPAQVQDYKDEIDATYRRSVAIYNDKIAEIRANEQKAAKESAEVIEREHTLIRKFTNIIADGRDVIDELRTRSAQITTSIEATQEEIAREEARPAHEIPEDVLVDIDTIAREYNITIDPDHDTPTDIKKDLTSLYNDLAEEEDRLRGYAPRDEVEKITSDLNILEEVLDTLEDEEKRAPHQNDEDHLNDLKRHLAQLQQDQEETEENRKTLTQKIDEAEEQIETRKGIISAHQATMEEEDVEARSNAADRLHEAEEEREAALSNLEKDQQRAEQADADTIEELKKNLPVEVEKIVNKYYFEDDIFSLEQYQLRD